MSAPPPVILKVMFLLVAYNVRSERELMATLPKRLDWLWFLGYGLDSDIPNHRYDKASDTYTCPSGKTLKRGSFPKEGNTVSHDASAIQNIAILARHGEEPPRVRRWPLRRRWSGGGRSQRR